MQQWEYLTVYLSDDLDFPNAVDRGEVLSWASKSITQRLNAHAARGWEIFNMNWLTESELMVTFKRPAPPKPNEDTA